MPPLPPKIECPDCRGRGTILLLIRVVPCAKCGGKGVLPSSILDIPVGSLDISQRAKTVLRQLKASTLREVVRLSERDLRASKEMTELGIAEVKKALAELGLSLRPSEPAKAGHP
ncbi:MAG TPA: DNA-directed RNA polymerase subunit alpha C-terminal domain-containing protein [Tepidisphaeraceae bacterium]|nr:DNA-directed RNA polymerase subunit alpha C-terminal domain-containing protein [Tepidisphaeraceae bacterium]